MKLLLSPSSSLKSGPGAAMMTAKLLLRGRRHHHQHHRVVRRIPVLVSTSSSGSNTFSDNECDCGFCPSLGMRMIKPPLSFNEIQQQQQSRYSSSYHPPNPRPTMILFTKGKSYPRLNHQPWRKSWWSI